MSNFYVSEGFFAEHGTDEYVRNTFFKDFSYKGVMIEVGGATPEFISASKHFKDFGWRTIIVEPNPVFAKMQRLAGNETFQCACSSENKKNVPFTVVFVDNGNTDKEVSFHSFSSLKIEQKYIGKNQRFFDSLTKFVINVETRTLDSIIEELGLREVDIISIDVEGFELEVLKGLTKVLPRILVVENATKDQTYRETISNMGYNFIKNLEYNEIYEKK